MNVENKIQILNIILLVICVFFFFLGVFKILKKDKKKNEKIISWVFTIVGLVFSISNTTNLYQNNLFKVKIDNIKNFYDNLFLSINNLNQVNWNMKEYITNIGTDSETVQIGVVNNQIIDSQTVNNNTFIEYEDMTLEELLGCAQEYYFAQNYEEIVRIYNNDKLLDNVVMLTNLGYMYANGIYFEQNFEIADSYYNKAIKLGYDRAYTHKLSMHLKYNLDDIIEIFREGFDLQNEIAMEYVAKFFKIEELSLVANYHCFCYILKEQDQVDIIENYMQYWELDEIVRLSSLPYNTKTEIYIPIALESYIDPENGIAGRDYIIEKYKLKCNMIEFLCEEFILQ